MAVSRHSRTTWFRAGGSFALWFALAVGVGCGSDAATPTATSLPEANVPSSVATTAPAPLRVSLDEARAWFDAGSAIFVDVRGDEAHLATRIPRAISIPLEALDARILGLERAQTIVTYCT